MFFQFFIICKRTNNATHYVKLGKKRRESSKRNYYIISPGVIIKAIIIIMNIYVYMLTQLCLLQTEHVTTLHFCHLFGRRAPPLAMI